MRRYPFCAYCGKSLVQSGRATMIAEWTDLAGSPMCGWHSSCMNKTQLDRDAREGLINDCETAKAEKMLAEIEERGPGRVVRLRRYKSVYPKLNAMRDAEALKAKNRRDAVHAMRLAITSFDGLPKPSCTDFGRGVSEATVLLSDAANNGELSDAHLADACEAALGVLNRLNPIHFDDSVQGYGRQARQARGDIHHAFELLEGHKWEPEL